MATIKSFTADGLFIGQSQQFLNTTANYGCRGRCRRALSVSNLNCPPFADCLLFCGGAAV